jgi:hypothetical protein
MRHSLVLTLAATLFILNTLMVHRILRGCSVSKPPSSEEMSSKAAYVVRVTALRYATPPASDLWTTGIPDSTVDFKVEEVLKGTGLPKEVAIKGYLSDHDDFNDHPAPYHFVRPGGRHGSCFANSYKRGAQFLLFLQKHGDEYSPYWYALGPVNEQLHDEGDPWVVWVKEYLRTAPTREGGAR